MVEAMPHYDDAAYCYHCSKRMEEVFEESDDESGDESDGHMCGGCGHVFCKAHKTCAEECTGCKKALTNEEVVLFRATGEMVYVSMEDATAAINAEGGKKKKNLDFFTVSTKARRLCGIVHGAMEKCATPNAKVPGARGCLAVFDEARETTNAFGNDTIEYRRIPPDLRVPILDALRARFPVS
jgi:hypothetical protein